MLKPPRWTLLVLCSTGSQAICQVPRKECQCEACLAGICCGQQSKRKGSELMFAAALRRCGNAPHARAPGCAGASPDRHPSRASPRWNTGASSGPPAAQHGHAEGGLGPHAGAFGSLCMHPQSAEQSCVQHGATDALVKPAPVQWPCCSNSGERPLWQAGACICKTFSG